MTPRDLVATITDQMEKRRADRRVHSDAMMEIDAELAGLGFSLDAAQRLVAMPSPPDTFASDFPQPTARAPKGEIESAVLATVALGAHALGGILAANPGLKPKSVTNVVKRLSKVGRIVDTNGVYTLPYAGPEKSPAPESADSLLDLPPDLDRRPK